MTAATLPQMNHAIKEPRGLSSRVQWLRDYYFKGNERAWNNEFLAWSTGTPWDVQFNEMTFYIVPETYTLLQTLRGSYRQAARNIPLDKEFWKWRPVERRAWFVKEVMVRHMPLEILPGDLIAGGRFNIQTSLCLDKNEQKAFDEALLGKTGARAAMKWFHDHGYGNAGATSGHLIPDHERVLKIGWKGILADLESRYDQLSRGDKKRIQRLPVNFDLKSKELTFTWVRIATVLLLAVLIIFLVTENLRLRRDRSQQHSNN